MRATITASRAARLSTARDCVGAGAPAADAGDAAGPCTGGRASERASAGTGAGAVVGGGAGVAGGCVGAGVAGGGVGAGVAGGGVGAGVADGVCVGGALGAGAGACSLLLLLGASAASPDEEGEDGGGEDGGGDQSPVLWPPAVAAAAPAPTAAPAPAAATVPPRPPPERPARLARGPCRPSPPPHGSPPLAAPSALLDRLCRGPPARPRFCASGQGIMRLQGHWRMAPVELITRQALVGIPSGSRWQPKRCWATPKAWSLCAKQDSLPLVCTMLACAPAFIGLCLTVKAPAHNIHRMVRAHQTAAARLARPGPARAALPLAPAARSRARVRATRASCRPRAPSRLLRGAAAAAQDARCCKVSYLRPQRSVSPRTKHTPRSPAAQHRDSPVDAAGGASPTARARARAGAGESRGSPGLKRDLLLRALSSPA